MNWRAVKNEGRGQVFHSSGGVLSLIFTLCLDCKTLLLIQFSSGRCVGRRRLQIWLFLGMLTVDLLSMPFELVLVNTPNCCHKLKSFILSRIYVGSNNKFLLSFQFNLLLLLFFFFYQMNLFKSKLTFNYIFC